MTVLFLLFFGVLNASPSDVVAEIERIDKMRTTLVQGVQGEVNASTFKAVCAPVGKEAKRVATKKGWGFKQVAKKYRNPQHKPDRLEKAIHKKFEDNPRLMSQWLQINGENHYFRRVRVEAKCLRCHGDKSRRPDFVKKKYPEDRAFGFKEGDLRGMYHVTFPIQSK